MNDELNVYYGINFLNVDDGYKNKFLDSRNILYNVNNVSDNYLNVYIIENKYLVNDLYYLDINELLRDYLVVPKLYINNIDLKTYKDKLINLEKNKDKLKNKIFNKYNKIFNKNFDVFNGINSIYEWYTGAVYFKDYEWEAIVNNPIKDLYLMMENNSYIYSLPVDDGILLRGANIYYYFSTDVSRFKKPTHKQIDRWFNNCDIFINFALKSLVNYEIKNNIDIRLLLGVVDNLRNIILLSLNTELLSINQKQDFIYNLNYNDEKVNKYVELVKLYQMIIEDLCLCRPLNKDYILLVNELLNKTKVYLKGTRESVSKINDEYILSKCFNPLREIDNYFENYIVCEYASDEIKKKHKLNDKINLMGVLYGGLELPFIVLKQNILPVSISFIFQNHGMYLDRQKKNKNVIKADIVNYGDVDYNLDTYIIDDNMMSGITIQFVYNTLVINNYDVKGIVVLRHPNINRLPQLIYFDTAVNLDFVDRFIFGMLTDTPYSKIKYNTNNNNMFVNELNIFSIMTEIFLKALYCNNSFIRDSQADIFMGYSEGKDEI